MKTELTTRSESKIIMRHLQQRGYLNGKAKKDDVIEEEVNVRREVNRKYKLDGRTREKKTIRKTARPLHVNKL